MEIVNFVYKKLELNARPEDLILIVGDFNFDASEDRKQAREMTV